MSIYDPAGIPDKWEGHIDATPPKDDDLFNKLPRGKMETALTSVKIDADTTIAIETFAHSREEDVADRKFQFDEAIAAVKKLGMEIKECIEEIKPTTAEIEFGVGFTIDAGKLTALLLKGQGEANLRVKLKWGENGK